MHFSWFVIHVVKWVEGFEYLKYVKNCLWLMKNSRFWQEKNKQWIRATFVTCWWSEIRSVRISEIPVQGLCWDNVLGCVCGTPRSIINWLLPLECKWAKFVNDPTTSSGDVCVKFYAHLTKMYIIWLKKR